MIHEHVLEPSMEACDEFWMKELEVKDPFIMGKLEDITDMYRYISDVESKQSFEKKPVTMLSKSRSKDGISGGDELLDGNEDTRYTSPITAVAPKNLQQRKVVHDSNDPEGLLNNYELDLRQESGMEMNLKRGDTWQEGGQSLKDDVDLDNIYDDDDEQEYDIGGDYYTQGGNASGMGGVGAVNLDETLRTAYGDDEGDDDLGEGIYGSSRGVYEGGHRQEEISVVEGEKEIVGLNLNEIENSVSACGDNSRVHSVEKKAMTNIIGRASS